MLNKNEKDESQTLSNPYEGLAPDEYIEDPFAEIDRSKLNLFELEELDMAEAQFRRSLLRPMFRDMYRKKRTQADKLINELGANTGEKGNWTIESKKEQKKPKKVKNLAARFKSKVKGVFSGKQKPKENTFTFEEKIKKYKDFIRIVHKDYDHMTQADFDFLDKYRRSFGIEGCGGHEGCGGREGC